MIELFENKNYYEHSGYPTDESRVSYIQDIDTVAVDGVNVITKDPQAGDAVLYRRGTGFVYMKGGRAFTRSAINSDNEFFGTVMGRIGNKALVLYKEPRGSFKYCQVVQFSLTKIEEGVKRIVLYLRMAGDYANYVNIEIDLDGVSAENGYINTEVVEIINRELEKAGNTGYIGYDNHGYWAFLADADNIPTHDNPDHICIQCDNWNDYRQYLCNNPTIANGDGYDMIFTTFGGMPAASSYFKSNGKMTNYMAYLNFTKFRTYYSTNGSTPSDYVNPYSGGNVAPVTTASFENSAYCSRLRAVYGNYDTYIKKEYQIRWPQAYSSFALPEAKDLSDYYADKTFIKKSGNHAFKFPALHAAAAVVFNPGWHESVGVGGFYLPGINEAVMIMDEDNLKKQASLAYITGETQFTNSAYRWYAQRCNVNIAWFYSGTDGSLNTNFVNNAYQVWAVKLLEV